MTVRNQMQTLRPEIVNLLRPIMVTVGSLKQTHFGRAAISSWEPE
jgi:hypothetical protein